MDRILLLMPTSTYRASAFLEAARRLGIEVVVGSERRQALEDRAPGRTLALESFESEEVTRAIVEFAKQNPLSAVIGVDDDTTLPAALACEALSLPGNSPDSARAARDKGRMRELLTAYKVSCPEYRVIELAAALAGTAAGGSAQGEATAWSPPIRFPCVVKPLFLSASRGVIRANDPGELRAALSRLDALLRLPEVAKKGGEAARRVLLEEYIPGSEVALEGILTSGELRVLALFDKPDPLEGPFFEETIYITPSRLPDAAQREIASCASAAARALGLRTGPVHAELRVDDRGPWLIEIAARSIGGLCSRTLRFGAGVSLEELILLHATGRDTSLLSRERSPAGVMMIPIPRAGILRDVRGREAALGVPGVEEVTISIAVGGEVVPLPEGNRYLGFIFARGGSPEAVEAALREAHGRLVFDISPLVQIE